MRKKYDELDDEDLARICHEAHVALRIGLNDSADDVHFDALSQERKDLVKGEVEAFRLGKSLAEAHQLWVDWMLARGWEWGKTRNLARMTHPNLVDFERLSVEEQAKVRQARAIVLVHVIPEVLEDISKDVNPADELTRLGEELNFPEVMVCLTHMRFIPCRREDGTCVFSEDPEDIEGVSRHQSG